MVKIINKNNKSESCARADMCTRPRHMLRMCASERMDVRAALMRRPRYLFTFRARCFLRRRESCGEGVVVPAAEAVIRMPGWLRAVCCAQ